MTISILFCIKLFIIIISLGYFYKQVRNAVENLMEMPTVDSTYELGLTEQDVPIITACPTNQTNYTRLDELGYMYKSFMYAGLSNCSGKSCISWQHHLNLSFEDLINQIHDIKLTEDIIFMKGPFKTVLEAKSVFLPRFGYCKELSYYNPKSVILISNNHTNTNLRVFLTDRLHRSHFSINFLSHIGDKMVIPYGTAFYTNVKSKIKTNCNKAL